jgi:hypothetical protein
VTAAIDPVGAHVAELHRVLRGPAAVKRSMIDEVRDGLADAAADHRDRGLDPQQAAAAAVREFGPVREIAPLLQEELTARQGRHTALLLVVAFPATVLVWDVLWMTGNGWSTPPTAAVSALARATDVLSVLVATAALVMLAATFRRDSLPRWATGLTGVLAAVGVVGCGGMSVVMNLLLPGGEPLPASPATTLAIAFTVVVAGLVTRSAARSLRFARACRGSGQGTDPQVG